MAQVLMTIEKKGDKLLSLTPSSEVRIPLNVGGGRYSGGCSVEIHATPQGEYYAAISGYPNPDNPKSKESHFQNLILSEDGVYHISSRSCSDGSRRYYGYLAE